MIVFDDEAKNADLESFVALNNRELFRRWQAIGVRLLDELPRDFHRAFEACRRRFRDPPAETNEPDLDNWDLLGDRLISASPEGRRIVSMFIVESLCALREAQMEKAPRRRSEFTFSRIAHMAELITEEATDYLKTDPDADEFFVELEQDDAQELEQLRQSHSDLIVIALGMSLNEWAIGYPNVRLVQIQFGDHNFDVQVRREN